MVFKLKKQKAGYVDKNKEFEKRSKSNELKHNEIEVIIEKTTKKPTIVNPESNFVIVTYWWGNLRQNNNTSRVCISLVEKFISQMNNVVMNYLTKSQNIDWDIFTKKFFTLSTTNDDNVIANILVTTAKHILGGLFDDVLKDVNKNNYNIKHVLKLLEYKKTTMNDELQKLSVEELDKIIFSTDALLALINNKKTEKLYQDLNISERDKDEKVFIANELLSKLNKDKYVLESRHVNKDFEFKTQDEIVVVLQNIWIKYLEICGKQKINPLLKIAEISIKASNKKKQIKNMKNISDEDKKIVLDYRDSYLRFQKESKDIMKQPVYAKNKKIPKIFLNKKGGSDDFWGKYNGKSIMEAFASEFSYIEPWSYKQMIAKWEVECANNNCNYLAVEYPEFAKPGGYQLAINAKPLFIKKALELCENRNVVYIDGDMFIRKYPKIFDLPDIDFMARGWNMDARASWKIYETIIFDPYYFQTSGGIMFFSQSKQSKNLLNKWIQHSQSYFQSGKADDRILSLVVNSYDFLLSMRIIQLPIEYLWLSLDYDERMLEFQYDWNMKELKESIIIEHAECLTSEETATDNGASSDRDANFQFVNDETYIPISELLHEFVIFPTKEYAKSFKSYVNYLNTEQYRENNDMIEYLEDNELIDSENPSNNARPFYVIPFEEKYGNIPHPSNKNITINSIAKANNYYVEKINDDNRINTNTNTQLIEIINEHTKNQFIIPQIIYFLQKNIPVLISKNPDQDPFYSNIKENIDKFEDYDMVFYNKNEMNNKHISHKFKPSIDTNISILFLPSSSTYLLKLLYMSINIKSIADLFQKGSYQFISLLRIKYLTHGRKRNSLQNRIIPYKIHQIWIGNRKMPILQKKFTKQWENTPGYEYKLWTNLDLNESNFPNTIHKINEIMGKPQFSYAMIVDLMRLEILYRYGGIYLDCTIEKIRGLPDFNNKEDFVISNEIPDPKLELPYVSNSFIASKPKHIVLERLLSKSNIDLININLPANKSTGPFYLRKGIENVAEVTYLPTNQIYPLRSDYLDGNGNKVTDMCLKYIESPGYEYIENDENEFYVKLPCNMYPDAYMIKHWDLGGSWIEKNENKTNIEDY